MNDASDSSPSVPNGELSRRLTVEIVEEGGDWAGFADLHDRVHAAVRALEAHPDYRQNATASVVLADDAFVHRLNRTYRGADKPTNVLTFPFEAPLGIDAGGYIGDVILAAETLQREAAEMSIPPTNHLQHLVLHGLLHLLGYDHAAPAEAEEMERLETELLSSLGVADPYGDPDEIKSIRARI